MGKYTIGCTRYMYCTRYTGNFVFTKIFYVFCQLTLILSSSLILYKELKGARMLTLDAQRFEANFLDHWVISIEWSLSGHELYYRQTQIHNFQSGTYSE